jgi:hypothetical protein
MIDGQFETLFVLSSALNTRFGIFKSDARLKQTLETCESIAQKAPGAKIVILESGASSPTEEQTEALAKYNVTLVDYTEHADVVRLTKLESHDIVKNTVETLVFADFYNRLFASKPQGLKRIFKLSSRYVLNDAFDYEFHMKQTGRIAIKGPYLSQFPANLTGGVKLQFMARLYSFDAELLPYMMCVYENSLTDMVDKINNKCYLDIEHCLFKYIKGHLVTFAPENPIGVSGVIAPSGVSVTE